MCVVVRENYRGKGKLYVPLLGGLSRVSQDTRTRHRHCHRALVRHGSHLSRNRLNLEPWFCYWLASALRSLTCLVLKIGAILEGRDTISSERAEDSLTAGVLKDASRAWQCTSMIPSFGRLKQEGCLGSTIKTKLNRKAGTAEAQFCQRSLPSCLLGPKDCAPDAPSVQQWPWAAGEPGMPRPRGDQLCL